MYVRRVPTLKLMLALARAKKARGALDVAVCSAPPSGTEGGKGSVQGTQEGIKLRRTNEQLPVIDKPFVADALVLGRVGEELLPKVRIARLPQHQRTLGLWRGTLIPPSRTAPGKSKLAADLDMVNMFVAECSAIYAALRKHIPDASPWAEWQQRQDSFTMRLLSDTTNPALAYALLIRGHLPNKIFVVSATSRNAPEQTD